MDLLYDPYFHGEQTFLCTPACMTFRQIQSSCIYLGNEWLHYLECSAGAGLVEPEV